MEYKGLIFTKHILERMKQRDLRPQDIYWIFQKPDEVRDSKIHGGKKYYRNYRGTRYALVAKQNERGQWIMVTCWWKDLYQEKKKYNRKNKNQGFFKHALNMILGK